ncbi:hypothetical protein [Dactylosporangium sp. CA-233914]|uniref:hypothetical protein n=1 Tax=Dactylosporangium sp. CA-233914 TaxID=3239934 RepID=UPI003D8EC26E
MADQASSHEPPNDPNEALIDDLIRDIFDQAGQSASARSRSSAGVLDAVMSAVPARGAAHMPMLERLLLAEALAAALADALAPALATALVPRIMKMLEHEGTGKEHDEHESGADTAGRPAARRTRKSDAR